MSTFKYLSEAQSSNAATEFLQKQLGKNKYTSGDPYAYGEGATPGGEAYRDQLKVTNQDEIDKWHAANPDYKAGGSPTKGKLSAEQIREKFGLEFNEAHSKESHTNVQKGSAVANTGALYGTNGEYVGTIKGFTKQSSDDLHPGAGGIASLQAIDQYAFDNKLKKTDGRVRMSTGWNSYNDVARAVEAVHGEPEQAEGPPKPEFKMDPIEHSPEIKQAKDRVKTYEENVMSGKTSQEIYGKGEAMADDKYVFDSTKGAAGIGTSPVSASSADASKATQSFLDNKIATVKKANNFQPA